MISLERQHELFHATLASINKSARGFQIYLTPPQLAIDYKQNILIGQSKPKTIDETVDIPFTEKEPDNESNLHDPDNKINRRIFDILGYFNSAHPEKVFLCDEKIKNVISLWQRNESEDQLNGFLIYLTEEIVNKILLKRILLNFDASAQILAEIIYLHEAAHYIHFHINSCDFLHWPKDDRNNYVETFAQLVTQRMVQDKVCSEHHELFFDMLLCQQSSEYTLFKDCKHEVFLLPEFIISNVFFQHSNNEASTSIISNLKWELCTVWRKMMNEYSKSEEDWKREYADIQTDLDEIGLVPESTYRSDILNHSPQWSSGESQAS